MGRAVCYTYVFHGEYINTHLYFCYYTTRVPHSIVYSGLLAVAMEPHHSSKPPLYYSHLVGEANRLKSIDLHCYSMMKAPEVLMPQCVMLNFAVKCLCIPCGNKSVQCRVHLRIQHACSIIILL